MGSPSAGTLRWGSLNTVATSKYLILFGCGSGSVDKHCAPVWAVEWRPIQTNSPKVRRRLLHPRPALMKVCLPPWVCLEIIGGLGEVLRVAEEERDVAEAAGGGQLLPDAVPATVLKFRPGDSTSYLVGTVAGHLLMCRTFERRGSVAVFQGHRGLVTALDWRPMAPPDPSVVFLSAALDDTLRVWHLDRRKSHCVLKNPQASSGPGGYVDACWCPWYNNLIACVHGGGLHLWDISASTHAPIVSHGVPGATCATFSPHTKNVVVGDASGAVWVVHLEGLTVTTSTAFHRFSSVVSRISMLGVKEEETAED